MMELAQLKKELKENAMPHDLCREWQRKLNTAPDRETLVRMYLDGIDFCFSNNFPTLGYIEEHFKGMCEPLGLYVNEQAALANVRRLAFVGRCSATLTYDSYEVAQVYVKDNSEVTIEADGHAVVTVDCFDRSVVRIRARNYASVIVNRYAGTEVTIRSDETGTVKVSEHKSKTYQ